VLFTGEQTGDGMTCDRRLRVGEAQRQPDVLGMVCDGQEIERAVRQLDGTATHVVDRLPSGKTVGIIGRRADIECVGVV
jgi:hypothetical protein